MLSFPCIVLLFRRRSPLLMVLSPVVYSLARNVCMTPVCIQVVSLNLFCLCTALGVFFASVPNPLFHSHEFLLFLLVRRTGHTAPCVRYVKPCFLPPGFSQQQSNTSQHVKRPPSPRVILGPRAAFAPSNRAARDFQEWTASLRGKADGSQRVGGPEHAQPGARDAGQNKPATSPEALLSSSSTSTV